MAFKASISMLVCVLVAVKATTFEVENAYSGQPPLKPPCDDHATPPAQSSPANATSPTTAPTMSPSSTPVFPTPQAPQPPYLAPTVAPQTPSSSPTMAPVYPTPEAPTSAPTSTPTYATPPTTVPGVPTTRNHLRYCVPECQRRCIMLRDQHKILRKIRPCVHVCTLCCESNKPLCVPTTQTTCPSWGSVTYHGGLRKCP